MLVGIFIPNIAVQFKFLGTFFISLIKLFVAPIIFLTICNGLAHGNSIAKSSKVALVAIIYFELITTLALILGLVVINVVQPGVGVHANMQDLETKDIAKYIAKTESTTNLGDSVVHFIPTSFLQPFLDNNLLQILFVALIFGFGLILSGDKSKSLKSLFIDLQELLFVLFGKLMRIAPFAAFGAMAFTVGKFGADTIKPLLLLMVCFYATCLVFIFVILNLVLRYFHISLFQILKYIKEEILLVLGTSSSESALPSLIEKITLLNSNKDNAKLIIPLGYSFNLDGTSIYLTMAAIFIAQAFDVPLTIGEQLSLLAVMLLTSKGAAAVTGGGFITLAASLQAIGKVPVEGLALLLGIDRFMSEARAITNLIGNAVCAIVIDRMKWLK